MQVHFDGEDARRFARNRRKSPTRSRSCRDRGVDADAPAILDGEVVAVDDGGDPLPFQEVLRRFRRKHDVAVGREDVAVGSTRSTVCTPTVRTCSTPRWKRATTRLESCSRLQRRL
ncbi:hypothetical protein C8039_02370 [Halogeometricum sp. wsp3]|nr:hypothetical protein C8039_02370 [Halogeometricum sp. wsp3]